MSTKTMFKQNWGYQVVLKILAIFMTAMFVLYFLTIDGGIQARLLALDSSVYFKNALVMLGAMVLCYAVLYSTQISSALQQVKTAILHRLESAEDKNLELAEFSVSDAEIQHSKTIIDWAGNLFKWDCIDWLRQPYWLLVTCKAELQKVEYVSPNQFIVQAYLQHVKRCMDRLETLHVPSNFSAMVEGVRRGDAFIDEPLYPYIKKGFDKMPIDTASEIIMARVVRFYLSDHEEYRLFPAIKPIISEPRLDDVQVIELESLVAYDVDGKEGENVH